MSTKTLRLRSRPLAVVAACFVVAVTASPAWAAPTISFATDCPASTPAPDPTPPPTPTPGPGATPAPTPSCFPLSAQAVRGNRLINFSVDAGNVDRLQYVQMKIVSEDPKIASPQNPVVRRDYADVQNAPRTDSFSYNWDTNALTPLNGAFTVEVSSKARVDDPVTVKTRKDIRVDNLPVTPTRPTVVASSSGGISLEWQPAPEKDFQIFRLYRARTNSDDDKPSSSDFEPRLDTTLTKSFDDVTVPGYYWYRLQVIRRSVVTPDTGIGSSLSPRSTGAGVIPEPTPTPTMGADQGSVPKVTPQPLSKVITLNKPPPVPDAPFSTVLDYGSVDSSGNPLASAPFEGNATNPGASDADTSARRKALPAAIGVFMVSAWAVLTRSRLLS